MFIDNLQSKPAAKELPRVLTDASTTVQRSSAGQYVITTKLRRGFVKHQCENPDSQSRLGAIPQSECAALMDNDVTSAVFFSTRQPQYVFTIEAPAAFQSIHIYFNSALADRYLKSFDIECHENREWLKVTPRTMQRRFSS